VNDDISLNVATCTPTTGGSAGPFGYTLTNHRKISGWTDVTLTRALDRFPSTFQVGFTERYPGSADVIVQPGDWVQVLLGADVVLTGFVDTFVPSYDGRQHMVRIAGSGKCQDLVDCSAFLPGGQILNQTVPNIAKTLCAPYGITVDIAPGTNVGDPIPQVVVLMGESVYSTLEILCRFKALLLYENAYGGLTFAAGGDGSSTTSTAIGTRVAASGLAEGINVLAASVEYSMGQRFSRIDAAYAGLDICKDIGDGGNVITSVYDGTVPRFRYHAVLSENVIGGEEVAKRRADWELAYRYGQSFKVRVTTDSWRDSAGALYEPNILIDVDLPSLKLPKKRWLVTEVTYRLSEGGTQTDLLIQPPESCYQQPTVLSPVPTDITAPAQ